MSGQVASQTRGRPELHGVRDIPSGLLPSDLKSPSGSRRDGTPAAERVRWMMLLTAAWRKWRPSLDLQLRPWMPSAETAAPQCWQVCGVKIAVPRRRPTAILNVLSSILKPTDVIGRACNHAPEALSMAASCLAHSTSSLAPSRRVEAVVPTLMVSQFFSYTAPASTGGLQL